jgi:S-DNA-T family DNA segregation ATPase FtsK/SpoIIIE
LDNDDFVPVPLYKNERWPGGNEKTTIHRATAPLKYQNKYQTEQEVIPRQASKKVAVIAEEKEDSNSAIIRKRSSRPFTPTEVPSPVYGYSRPKTNKLRLQQDQTKSVTETHALQSHSESDFIQNEEDVTNERMAEEEIHRIDLEEHAHTVDKEKLTEPKSDHSAEWNLSNLDESENDMEMDESPLTQDGITSIGVKEEIAETYEEKVFEERAVEIEETMITGMTDDEEFGPLQNPLPKAKEDEEQEHDFSYNVAIEDKLEPSETMATPVTEEFGSTQDLASSSEKEVDGDYSMAQKVEMDFELANNPETITDEEIVSERTEQKKEKIVPFNVLMLKNDKLKYEEREKRVTSYSEFDSTINNIERTDTDYTESNQVAFDNNDDSEEIEVQPYYAFPSKGFLIQPEEHIEDTDWLQSQSEKLEEALSYFAVQANVIEAVQGPTVTRFELTVGHGTKVSKVRNLTDDLKLALAAEDIRIQAPIPGTSSIGIEIPNRKPRAVRISEVIETKRFQDSESPLEAVLGLSLTGDPVTLDLRKMPHGMIAGATGSGKSVCINSILISLLYKASPSDLKMLLIDPKMVELAPFNGIPHLLSPVITDVKAATAALKWAVGEMERRYELFAHVGARNIERYNEMAEKDRKFSLKLPYLLIVIDELADLMMMAPADVEVSISRITQKARACGIHLIIATQRPSVDVITGTIKANVPTRIAFSVSSQIDSRTIIDTPGAERLLGKGDMLYLGNGQSSAMRLQGTFVTDAEIERIIEHVQNEAEPDYLFGQEDLLANTMEEEESDPLFADACKFILEQGSASTSLLQRNFGIGYNRAAKLMDRMEKLGFVSEQRGSKAREVYLTESELNHFLNGNEKTV